MKEDELVDIIVEELLPMKKQNNSQPKYGFFLEKKFNQPWTSLKSKKIFVSEYEIKQKLKQGIKVISIPKNAILSPLLEEELSLKGIKIIRE